MRKTRAGGHHAITGISLLGLVTVFLVSCVGTPADLLRTGRGAGNHSSSRESALGSYLELALESEDTEKASDALAHFVEEWKVQRKDGLRESLEVLGKKGPPRRYRVRFLQGHHGSYPLSYFDEISPAVDFRVQRIKHHRRKGVGAPLVAIRYNRKKSAIESFYPPEAITRPLTAVIESTRKIGGVTDVNISLLCPLRNDEIKIDGKMRPLAADFSVPWAALLAKSGKLGQSRILEALRPMPKREPQLYLMEPYDPKKEPLIMIHGLFDTPLAWAKLSNDLWADEKFREKYQIWHFLYNTSAPALYSGRMLRTQLRKLRPMLDPSGRDPAMKSTTVIAHSMGGIVTRSLITRPGQVFWDAAFTRPFDSLKLGESDRSLLREAFFWEPERHVRRVIYIAVPHRGSNFADNFLGRIGRWLVEPPNKFAEFYARISSANPGAFTPAYAALGSGKLDSVHALSPRQPTLQILSRMPSSHRVATHSIIGNRGLEGPLKDSSDGVVEYWSSHLDHADSEKIVPSDHSAIDHSETVEEIRRILELP